MTNLVIVESPAKAKTIEKYLGKGFTVRSSYGHIRDIQKKGMGIDIDHGFLPNYEISADKKKTVAELRKLTKTAETVWLATDEDREGEAIAWHLAEALNLDVKETKRIVFHEITQTAIQKAIAEPRLVDMDLVDAQQARRILDRIVGFELSPILWKKIRTGLSAGRVQSVAVRLIVEREREIDAFTPEVVYRLQGQLVILDAQQKQLGTVDVKRNATFKSEAEALAYLQAVQSSQLTVGNLEEKPAKKSPKPPFTTSTLQQEAAAKLGFSVKQTMMVAQRLYESGKITYMRTDSLNLSDEAIQKARSTIVNQYGEKFAQTRRYKTKNADAQEAHEAIRPTEFSLSTVNGERNEQRLYQLIWRRAMASQMTDAQFLRTTVDIAISGLPKEKLSAKGEVITFEGFLKVYDLDDDAKSSQLPPMTVGQHLKLGELTARQSFSRAPARYNEASLVRTLEEMGIGRPSTYAPTIDTIQQRGYVVKEDREGTPRDYRQLTLSSTKIDQEVLSEMTGTEKNKLFPTDIAGIVTSFLVKHFGDVLDYQFTAMVESEFDVIAQGKESWQQMLTKFYSQFHPKVVAAEDVSREEAGQARLLGTDPKTGKPMFVKIGRFGPYVQLGDGENEEKPTFASLMPGQKMDTLKLDEAVELFKLPREVGEMPESFAATAVDGTVFSVEKGQVIIAKQGPFGPYLEYGTKKYAPIKGTDPLSITLDEAVALVEAKIVTEAEKIIKVFKDTGVKILKGRWGPYITDEATKKNAKIKKDEDPLSLSFEECVKRLEEAPEPKKRGRSAAKSKKAPAKKSATKKAPAKKSAPKKAPAKKTVKA
ncbi:MAG: type I DNA topoisomerase [Piscirickettsiaceae bacterium CG_4_9_14_3_um_filter_43_564]|nr:type I DNA topoisomerase [Thiomicrospira sp.]OIP95129.1 MAG: DNA topoisomerase I [Thiomicrospira sp. CG2_30_44_34]PIQ03373.1 MAG: DNA topoisomerase I [Piscirickettsiaceae bacterium CG18_big_fil_WC_8_21_14_2_50_44_103]PIU39168.1 MAG: type I DNA topoisomerase [Piscirickettsiaceae bacterium CG07_land_8_20_14_0_80_44_28]PIW56971.1 MAG: type I DNA topoisomerase [Piscirickettsiaceae bacterium CG12_big_fil_rev_8_21_14_0_65_44_934]PIW76995.1 MAG: type I DNA topoisomerase [Piscirickettsiaceae bacter